MTSSKKPDEIEDIQETDLTPDPEKADEDPAASEEEPTDAQSADAPDQPEVEPESDATEEPVEGALVEDAEEAPSSEPVSEASKPVAAQPASSGGGFIPTLLGGAIAAAIGFGVSQFLMSAPEAPDLQPALDQQSDQIAALQSAIDALKSAPAPELPDLTGPLNALQDELSGSLGDLSAGLSALTSQIDAVDARLTELEKRPIATTDTSGAVEAYERELAEIREELAGQQAKNDEMSAQVAAAAEAARAEIDEASSRARAIEAQAAVQAVQAALDAGTSYAASLAALPGDVPAALSGPAEAGVATLPELKNSFDEFARKALSAALKETPGDSTADRIESFLRSQLNIRSLSPRDGDDADAVLSRAQGALSANDLAGALAEIASLPETGQAAMADWTAQAQARLAAIDAIETLATTLSQN